MAKILVTGGAGFVGSHLVDRLLKENNEVIVADNLFTGNKKNLEPHFGKLNFEFIRHDITESLLVEVDQIYHLACPASPVHYQYNPVKTVKTCVMGTINMLGLAKRVKAKFLLASTSEVYGDPLEHPQTEAYWGNVNSVGPRACYDEGKRVAETLANDYRLTNNVDAKIIRIFNTYGPRMLFDDGRVVSNFVVQALKNQDITIQGTGEQTRSFCYVSDLVDGIIKVMNSEHSGPINLGNPKEMTMIELAKKVIEFTGSKSKLIHVPARPEDPQRRQPDITLAKKVLGWEPTCQLEYGLKETIAEFKERLLNEV